MRFLIHNFDKVFSKQRFFNTLNNYYNENCEGESAYHRTIC